MLIITYYMLCNYIGSVSHSYQPSNHVQPSRSEAATKFQFLDRNYSLETPSCLLPQVNELFKSICERYDIAVTNREKVDEALQLFKKVLQVDPTLPIVDCFTTWKSQLTSPRFNVTWGESSLSRGEPSSSQGKLSSSRGESLSQDVKKITVRAEEVPRLKRKAQKHIRDLLDACHLFLQQRDFLQREIANDLEKLELISRDIPSLCKGANLSSSERKQMPQVVKRARDQFAQFPTTIDWFWNQVFALLSEINTAVHVLQDSSE